MKIYLYRTSMVLVLTILMTMVLTSVSHAADYRNYMAAGDSITYGVGTSNPPATSYPSSGNIRGKGIGGSCLIAHPAYDGSGCAEIRSWLPSYVASLDNKPSVIVAMIGTNDYPFFSASDIVAAMKDLKAIMAARGVRVVFGTITPAPSGSYWNIGPSGIAKQTRLAVNDWIRAHDNYQGPEYARALQCTNSDLCSQYINYQYNDVHVNDYGAAVMGNVLRNWIEADR